MYDLTMIVSEELLSEVIIGSYEWKYKGTFALGVFDFRLGGGSDLFYVNQRKSVPSVSSAFLYPNNEVSFAFQMLIFKAV